MKLSDTKITIAGVFRCCVAHFQQMENKTVKVGDKMVCQYCKESFILRNDQVWVTEHNYQIKSVA